MCEGIITYFCLRVWNTNHLLWHVYVRGKSLTFLDWVSERKITYFSLRVWVTNELFQPACVRDKITYYFGMGMWEKITYFSSHHVLGQIIYFGLCGWGVTGLLLWPACMWGKSPTCLACVKGKSHSSLSYVSDGVNPYSGLRLWLTSHLLLWHAFMRGKSHTFICVCAMKIINFGMQVWGKNHLFLWIRRVMGNSPTLACVAEGQMIYCFGLRVWGANHQLLVWGEISYFFDICVQ